VNESEKLLRRLAANDETALQAVLSSEGLERAALDRETWALVQLSALFAVDADTTTLRWAVEVAARVGADEGTLVQVLLSGVNAIGTAQAVTSAPRLALALDRDIEVEGPAGR
jgi:alkylhydroperoxidase/carboxymuconolactone decarboxylase family protein YurZ